MSAPGGDSLTPYIPSVRSEVPVHVYERAQARQQQERLAPAPAPAPPPRWPLQDDTLDAAAVQPPPSEAAAEERRAVRAVWRRLRAADLPREEHALAVRLLHGSLYVGAFEGLRLCCCLSASWQFRPQLVSSLPVTFLLGLSYACGSPWATSAPRCCWCRVQTRHCFSRYSSVRAS